MCFPSRLCMTTIGLLVVFAAQLAAAQSNQEWIAYKQSCRIPMGLDYATWMRQGCHCPARDGGNSNYDNGPAHQAFALNAEGIAAFSAKDYARAEKLFGQAAQMNPNNPTIAENLTHAREFLNFQSAFNQGIATFNTKNYTDAVGYFEQANEIVPNNTKVMKWLQSARDGLQDQLDTEAWQAVLALNDQGNAAFEAQNYADAVRYYEQALEKAPNNATLRESLQDARNHVHAESAESARRDVNAQSLSSLSETLSASKSLSSPHDTISQSNQKTSTAPLEFMPSGGAASSATHFFGATSTPSNPNLGPKTRPQSFAVYSEIGRLGSAAESAIDAKIDNSPEAAQYLSGCAFDYAACRSPSDFAVVHSVPHFPLLTSAQQASLANDPKYKIDAAALVPAKQNAIKQGALYGASETQRKANPGLTKNGDFVKSNVAAAQRSSAASNEVATIEARIVQDAKRIEKGPPIRNARKELLAP